MSDATTTTQAAAAAPAATAALPNTAPVQTAAAAFQQAMLSGQQLAGVALVALKAQIAEYAADVENAATALGTSSTVAKVESTVKADFTAGYAELKAFVPDAEGFFRKFTTLDWVVTGGGASVLVGLVYAAAHFGAHL
jgi:hypothetical protein